VKILYLGGRDGTAIQRADALVRLGHQVTHVDPQPFVPSGRFTGKFHRETGGLLCQSAVAKGVIAEVNRIAPNPQFDAAWVDGGRNVGPGLIASLKKFCKKVINYNHDDPFGNRDRFFWALYLKSVPFYDVVGVVRPMNVDEAKAKGAKNVVLVKMAGDEVAHRPREISGADVEKWASEVLFMGTWMPERGPFLRELVFQGIPLTIYGDRWQKAPEWPELQSSWRGRGVSNPDDYAKVLQCSKVALGLLSKGNRDMHTTRSTEIPSVGALLCAERTEEHEDMYKDGVEAVFWSNAKECAEKCRWLLDNEKLRAEIAARGRIKAIQNKTFNEPTMALILERAFE
jgi:spore maturation protein CgeB